MKCVRECRAELFRGCRGGERVTDDRPEGEGEGVFRERNLFMTCNGDEYCQQNVIPFPNHNKQDFRLMAVFGQLTSWLR
jgi:hypothetical protein